MIFHAAALTALIEHCAPNVASATMTAIVNVESGGDSLAIGDNTTSRSYYPRDRASAEILARQLLEAGHSIDAGIAQIDSMNFAGFGVSVHSIFDPCTNISIGARILSDDYSLAAQRYRNAQVALRHAIGMYNTGRLNGGRRYIAHVLAADGIRDVDVQNFRTVSKHNAMHAPPLLRAPNTRFNMRGLRRARIAPARAPILVSNVPHVVVF